MSHYTVEALPLISFLGERDIKLPRFQRRSAWNKKQNFELIISIFQQYPVGVVILNQEKNVTWLLDGRQRRSALKIMHENPVELYHWAKSYIGFRPKADDEEIRRVYWDKITKYLEKENEELFAESETAINADEFEDEIVTEEEYTFDRNRQEHGLKTLLSLILMVHQIKNKGLSQWERNFDFRDECYTLPYADKRGDRKIDPKKLKDFVLAYSKTVYEEGKNLSEETFLAYLDEVSSIQEEKMPSLKSKISASWEAIRNSIDTISASEKILSDARIGVIRLHNATPLDAQNIFTRINSGGTQLKSEELLSAKPFWNKPVEVCSPTVKKEVHAMYERLQIPVPTDIVRWDIAATLISRLDDKGLLFDRDNAENSQIERITLGFKLISARYLGGISKKHVTELENASAFKERKLQEIQWPHSIDEFVYDLNVIFKILLEDKFFKCLSSWGKPIIKMLSAAIALEYCTLLWRNWEDKGRPTVMTSGDARSLQRDAKILFDRMVLEYAKGVWKGSSDSRMANNLRNWKSRFQKVDGNEWINFIESAVVGRINGAKITEDAIRAILYYAHSIKLKTPVAEFDVSFDLDHIIPQESFKGNSTAPEYYESSLSNLTLLPTKDNITKKAKRLSDITDEWLKKQIIYYSGIEESDFSLFSDLSNWQHIQIKRKEYFRTIFEKERDFCLNN